MNKFYNFKNEDEVTELYLYGAIVSDKWSDDEVSFTDFRDALDEIKDNGVLNIYVNSPGGEVFTTDSIISMLDRCKKKKNIKVNAYIDGLGASCASWLPMVADDLYIYDQSILMLHKPMTSMWGANANDMRKQIEVLDKIEDSMITLYLSKAKEGVSGDKIREMLANETWLSSNEIEELFNVNLIKSDKKLVACVDDKIFSNYKNIPEELINNIDNSAEEVKKAEEQRLAEEERIRIENKRKEIEIALALLS